MKILLVGEYSRLHNSLKEGLTHLGHQVTLIGTRDGYKNFSVDINTSATFFNKSIFKFFVKAIDKIFGISLIKLELGFKFYKKLNRLKGFDVVQLINENSIKTIPVLEVWLLKKLVKQNNKIYLLSCGTDYLSVKHAYNNTLRYSIVTPLLQNPTLKKKYRNILKYLTPAYIKLHNYVFSVIKGVIASDLDYHIPLKNHPKYSGLIANPINIDTLTYKKPEINSRIVIFHGVSTSNFIKKGNCFFDKALEIIKAKFGDRVDIIKTENIPYKEYINHYNNCHILLDQVYAYDQGYNALEAMAKGKVVFTGAEQEWLDYYNLKEDTVAINALPDANLIAKKLEWLILNPDKIIEISKNARTFIEKEHHYISIAKRYLEVWKK